MLLKILITICFFEVCHAISIQNLTTDQVLEKLSNLSRDNAKNITERSGEQVFFDKEKFRGVVTENGEYCMVKLVMREETVYDRGMECKHTFKKECHLTYITDYISSRDQKCETNYRKSCHIVFKAQPHQEKVKLCHTPLKHVCDDNEPGPNICTTEYESLCETTFKKYQLEQDEPECKMVEKERCQDVPVELFHLGHKDEREGKPPTILQKKCENWPVQQCVLKTRTVTKIHPETSCKKIPKKVCIPNNCKVVPTDEICHEQLKTVVQNIPEEECDLEPEENCNMESSLVPRLVPKKNCIKVPKEVCVNTKKNPVRIPTPILKEWCFDPEEISTMFRGD
uniref:Uncharacterized protein n=1 Tax=Lepeophtheirus salmonis TaxID=72036 RepID=A0A0K2T055_LEPSM